MKIHFLGDIHGCWGILDEVLCRYGDNRVIQVGDMGIGFPLQYKTVDPAGEKATKMGDPDPLELTNRFSFIRGNHDNPDVCRKYPNYLGDFGIMRETGIFYVSGANSIDANMRKIGIDWWDDEELSYTQFNQAIELYEVAKPRVVVSHEAPASVTAHLTKFNHIRPSKTAIALEAMLKVHKPDLWVFGHHHMVWRKQIDKTLFVCAATNQVVTFDVVPMKLGCCTPEMAR